MSQKRLTNIEWLRIVAMVMILFSHFSTHGLGGVLANSGGGISLLFNRFWLDVTTTGNIGNALFMIISGYFLCTSKQVRVSRLFRIIIEVFTYSVVIYVLFTLFWGEKMFSKTDLFIALTPLIHKTNWYFSAYVLIYIFHPFINRLIEGISMKELRNLILVMVIVWSVIPTFFMVEFNRSDFILFTMLYLIGAYIRLYPTELILKNYKKILCVSIILWLFIASLAFLNVPHLYAYLKLLYLNGSPLVIILSISLFLYFIDLKTKDSKIVKTIAGCMGGVYLLHDNPYMRSILYTDIFNIEKYVYSCYLVPIIIGSVFITLLFCSLIELLRKSGYDFLEQRISLFIRKHNWFGI